jgi:hypothetical protein|tara:strand:- start:280 stop:429 length:150 start_codon:yes stop_codon:yes gene_type:complete
MFSVVGSDWIWQGFDLILVQDLLGNPSKPVASTAESGLAETSAELQVGF